MERGAGSTESPTRGFVYRAAALAAVGGLLFGYDTGVISGALLFLRKAFHLSHTAQEVVVSVVLLGALVGALAAGRLTDRFGRRTTLLATSLVFIVGALLCAAAPTVDWLIAGRLVVGVAIGLASTAVPVYISEIAPAAVRGWMVSLFQLAVTLGIVVAYAVDYAFAHVEGWRWMLGLAVVPALVLGAGMLVMPNSPRWLLMQGREAEARQVLDRIREPHEIDGEVREIAASLHQQRGTWRELLTPAVRPALVVGVGLAIFQQVTGINTVIYYAPTILQTAGFSSASGAILATLGIGVVNVLMTVVALPLLDRVGRRPLLLGGIAGMAISLGLLGFAFRSPALAQHLGWASVIGLMLYVGSFALSLGPVFWLLIAEIYPLRIRGLAASLAAAVNWASNGLVALTFLSLIHAVGRSWAFWLYALLSVAAWLFTWLRVPETRGRTLEEIEAAWRSGSLEATTQEGARPYVGRRGRA